MSELPMTIAFATGSPAAAPVRARQGRILSAGRSRYPTSGEHQ
jgi:hypothetical protein